MAKQAIVAFGFDSLVDRMVEHAKAVTPEVIEEGLGEIMDEAQSRWPVDSGASRSAFRFNLIDRGDEFSAEVRNASGYAQFINRGRTYDELVTTPFRRFMRGLPSILARRIAEGNDG